MRSTGLRDHPDLIDWKPDKPVPVVSLRSGQPVSSYALAHPWERSTADTTDSAVYGGSTKIQLSPVKGARASRRVLASPAPALGSGGRRTLLLTAAAPVAAGMAGHLAEVDEIVFGRNTDGSVVHDLREPGLWGEVRTTAHTQRAAPHMTSQHPPQQRTSLTPPSVGLGGADDGRDELQVAARWRQRRLGK